MKLYLSCQFLFHCLIWIFWSEAVFYFKTFSEFSPSKKVYRRNTCTCCVPFIKFEITRILHNSRICPDLITCTYPSCAPVYIGKYLQLQHAVSIPEKISISLNRGHEEFMDDYYTLRAEATSFFFAGKVSV